jgi:hypothetical protein
MARVWNSLRHFASIKAIPNDSVCRRDNVRVSLSILLSAWRPAAPVKLGHSTRDFNVPTSTSRSTYLETPTYRALSRSVEGDRRHPHREFSLDDSCRRVDFTTKLDSVRAPIVPWMINEKPTSYVRSRGSLFSNSTILSQVRELRNREGVDPNGSLGGVHLSFYHPHSLIDTFRWPTVRWPRSAFDRRIAPYLRTTIFTQSVPATFSKSSTSRSRNCPQSTHPRFARGASRVIPLTNVFHWKRFSTNQGYVDCLSMATTLFDGWCRSPLLVRGLAAPTFFRASDHPFL